MIDLGLLVLRFSVGGMLLFAHGWEKLMNFSQLAPTFPNPLGLGSQASLGLTVFSEVFCSILVMLGVATRLTALPPLAMLGTAVVVVHGSDPFPAKEIAILYALPFLCLVISGPGRFSLDALLSNPNSPTVDL
jgi:putative oxidoreductase